MSEHIKMMRIREEEIGKLIESLSEKSKEFTEPKLVMVGGYALRFYIPFSRYTRDCDFILKKRNGWYLDLIKSWFPELEIESFQKEDDNGYLRLLKLLKTDKRRVKVSIDFMEGKVTGREKDETVVIDEKLIQNSVKTGIQVGSKTIKIFVPSYQDYFILKVVSGRQSDIRDIAALVWKNGIPENLEDRLKEVLSYPDVFVKKLKVCVRHISNENFVNSWRGTFVSTSFTEETKKSVLGEVKLLLDSLEKHLF